MGGDKPSGQALFTPLPQARARARGVEDLGPDLVPSCEA